jgi:GNAT superfamily N-acetyltransferase
MTIQHLRLQPPYPADFAAWYPYTRDEVLPPDHFWRPWLDRLLRDDTGSLRNSFFTARDTATGDWLGVVWCAQSPATPELAHFGWFLVPEKYQGQGLGRDILHDYLATVEGEGVEMVMLPAETTNLRAVGMYQRRGWEITIAQAERPGRCWMVREPDLDYQPEYFRAGQEPLEFGPPMETDFIGLDYLLCRPLSQARLLPGGFIGNRRFCSFVVDWTAALYTVARAGGKPVGLGAVTPDGGLLDAFALDPEVLAALLTHLAAAHPQAEACAAADDGAKYEVLRNVGFRPRRLGPVLSGGEEVAMRFYARQ